MTVVQIISLIVVVLLAAVVGFFIIRKSEKHDLIKWVSLFLLVSISLSWIFSGAKINIFGMEQVVVSQGLTDIPFSVYRSIGLVVDKIIFLLALGAFYGVLSKSDAYKKLVTSIAEKFKGKEIIFALISSLLITAITSLFSQSFIALVIIPFIISIILAMKLDKITAFCVTFGSMLIGTLGVTYGGEGLYGFNYYISTTIETGILARFGILAIAFVLFNFFTVMHAKKLIKNKKLNEKEEDPFKIEKFDKKVKVWPLIILLVILLILMVLGYIRWNNFGISCFTEFHTWLTGLKIGNFEIFKVILGSYAASFGEWDLFHASLILLIFSILISLLSRIKLTDFISACEDGVKNIMPATLLFVGVNMVMAIAFSSNFLVGITDLMFTGVEKFNPFLMSLNAFITNIFHLDFSYTGYTVATNLISLYEANLEIIHVIFTTMYGFVGLIVPTSAVLLIGLSYLKIDFKTWVKYIWKFILAILVVLLIIYSLMTYVI